MIRLSWFAFLIALFCASSNNTASAGWPFFSEDGLRRGSPEYYEAHAHDPPGARQKYKYGRVWPVRARPVGPSQTFVHRYHTAHYWPHPYQCQDRAAVQAVCATQVQNGWQNATTFYSYHFDEKTNELNAAGQRHLSWLMSDVPEQYRHAYVAVEVGGDSGSRRISAIERTVAGTGIALPVTGRVASPLGRPATEVKDILDGAAQNALPPVIQYVGSGGSVGSGG